MDNFKKQADLNVDSTKLNQDDVSLATSTIKENINM